MMEIRDDLQLSQPEFPSQQALVGNLRLTIFGHVIAKGWRSARAIRVDGRYAAVAPPPFSARLVPHLRPHIGWISFPSGLNPYEQGAYEMNEWTYESETK
jgi:hypothetical protein